MTFSDKIEAEHFKILTIIQNFYILCVVQAEILLSENYYLAILKLSFPPPPFL